MKKTYSLEERRDEFRILAVVSETIRTTIARQLEPLSPTIEYVEKAGEIAHLVGEGKLFDVAIVPAALPNAKWRLSGVSLVC